MRRMFCGFLLVGFLAPALSLAVPMGRPDIAHPLAMTPAEPVTPPEAPAGGTHPVLDLTMPRPHSMSGELSRASLEAGSPPDLTGRVDLPDAASPFPGKGARPFGGAPAGKPVVEPTVVPEPGTGLLMMLGLGGLVFAGRRRR
jgi:hypothetical protein